MKKIRLLLSLLFLITISACSGASTTQSASGGDDSGAVVDQQSGQEPFIPFAGLTRIELLTPSSGAGEKPLFEWLPIEGASEYSLFLQFPDGQPYWSWLGSATTVYLGGSSSAPSPDAAGPILLDGMSWAVIAFDTQGNVIASSNLQAISP